jgi:hypothetical protein
LPRLSIQDFTTLVLIGTLSFGATAAEAIGVAVARGSFEIDNSQVYGNTTLFDGSTIRTGQASSRLQLKNGTRLDLGEESQAKVFDKQATLERGMGEVEGASKYEMEARTLRISPVGAKSIARVKLEGEKQVLVAAVNGRVRVVNDSGLLVANVQPGATLLFTPQAGQAGSFQMSGCLVGTKDGKFLLVDANQTVELRGTGLAAEINNHVDVTGTAFRSAVPTPPAVQVVQADGVKRVEEGGCIDAINKMESAGVKVLRPGQSTAGNVPKATKSTSHAGIYAGVGVAVAGGIGAAVALSGKKKTSP